MENHQKAKTEEKAKRFITPAFSKVLHDQTLIELVYDPGVGQTGFAVAKNGEWEVQKSVRTHDGQELVPYSATNTLIKHGIVLLPSTPEEYGTEQDMVRDIQTYIHRYVDLSPQFERIATYYVLFTWLFDAYRELPYLRFRGDFGTGKTRALIVLGSICNKPIFASACSTISPIFRLIDATEGGTLVLDEADFRFSDEKAEIVKILNNGNVKGLPVLRTEVTASKEFNPQAYNVYGPKMIATRGYFSDNALESRCIVEEMGGRVLRDDVPINLPECYQEEAQRLRNKLLLYRFRTYGNKPTDAGVVDRHIEPRLRQIIIPLMSVISNNELRAELRELVRSYNRQLVMDRGMDIEAQVLEVIRDLSMTDQPVKLTIKNITAAFVERFGEDYERHITPKWVGTVIRRKLQLKTYKSDGNFIISPEAVPALSRLYERYGVVQSYEGEASRDIRDDRDVVGHEEKGERPIDIGSEDVADTGEAPEERP